MIYELNHVGIVIRDLDASLAFYQGALDATVVFQNVIPATGTDVVYLQIADGLVELLHTPDQPDGQVYGIDHIAFLSDDLDGDHAALIASGYTSLVPPKVAGTGVGRLGFLSGPGGERVELLQRELAMRAEPASGGLIAGFDHYSVRSDDLEAGERFYRDGLGLKPIASLELRASGESIPYFGLGTDAVELLDRHGEAGALTFDHIALRVDDVDAALAELGSRGVGTEEGWPRAAGTGLGRLGVIRDPDGVKIELLDRASLHSLEADGIRP